MRKINEGIHFGQPEVDKCYSELIDLAFNEMQKRNGKELSDEEWKALKPILLKKYSKEIVDFCYEKAEESEYLESKMSKRNISVKALNEELERILNEDIWSDLADDIGNSKTAKNIKQGIDNVKTGVKNTFNNVKKSLNPDRIKKDIKHALNKPDLSTQAGIDAENDYLFDKDVPAEGNADTLGGELIRALNKIEYRFFNDGDKFGAGYGIETCGHSAAFIYHNVDSQEIKNILEDMMEYSTNNNDDPYEAKLKDLKAALVKYVTDHKKEMAAPATEEMEDYKYVQDNVEVEYKYYYSDRDYNFNDIEKYGYPAEDSDVRDVLERMKDDIESDWGEIEDYSMDSYETGATTEGTEVGYIEATIAPYDEEDEEPTVVNGTVIVGNTYLTSL